MPKFNVTVPHHLSQREAQEKLQSFIDRIVESQGGEVENLQQSWNENILTFAFKTFGIQLQGTMTVEDKQVHVEGDLPFTAMLFKGKIETSIRDQLTKRLSQS